MGYGEKVLGRFYRSLKTTVGLLNGGGLKLLPQQDWWIGIHAWLDVIHACLECGCNYPLERSVDLSGVAGVGSIAAVAEKIS